MSRILRMSIPAFYVPQEVVAIEGAAWIQALALPMRAPTLSLFLLAACGSSTTPKPDAAKDIGFNKPIAALHGNTASGSTVTDVGLADLPCLGTASADQATTVAVTLATVVKDFQNHTLNGGASDAVAVSG